MKKKWLNYSAQHLWLNLEQEYMMLNNEWTEYVHVTSSRQFKDHKAWLTLKFNVHHAAANNKTEHTILCVTSVSRLNKTEALINSHQVWLRYDSDMAQHSFSSPTFFSFTNILFIYITFFSCHKHISFRPNAVSEHYINRSFCINLLLYS